jgi:C4-dicarboxylate transporter DctQ subunit
MNPFKNSSRPDSVASRRAVPSRGVDRWERADEAIAKVELTLIVIFLSSMIFVAFLQIVLRNAFSTGLDWGDSFLRNLVLWIGFIGATLATREGRHINIDIVSRWLPSFARKIVMRITHLFSFAVCCLLTYAAFKFLRNEVQMGHRALLDIPVWIPEIILPMTFGLMAFRFGLRAFRNLPTAGKTNPTHEQEQRT